MKLYDRRLLSVAFGLAIALTFGLVPGCGSDGNSITEMHSVASDSELESYGKEQAVQHVDASVIDATNGALSAQQETVAPTPSLDTNLIAQPAAAASKRKIIYNTHLDLIVQDYQSFELELPALVDKFGGFIAKSKTNHHLDGPQSGSWVARVPVQFYTSFLKGVAGLGFAESRREDAQDVTDQFVDMQSRIRNQKKLEERVLSILEKQTGNLSEVLKMEHELSRVREGIERIEGRLRMLADQTSFATISIHGREEPAVIPPELPNFVTRISGSFNGSLAVLGRVLESLLLVLVTIVPWLVTFGIPASIVVWGVRQRQMRLG